MEITPTGDSDVTDVTEADIDLDSALDQAFAESTEEDVVEDTAADEAVDTELEDSTEEDEAPDAEAQADESEDEVEAEDDSDDTEVQKFTVKVNGEDVEVTLEDALSGYMRQADYTRKTQELSQERERHAAFDALNEALQADPAGTLTKLSRLYGVELGTTQSDTPDPLEDLDPALAAEIRELRQFQTQFQSEWEQDKAQREAAQRTAQVDAEIVALRTATNDPALDTEDGQAELLSFAIDNGIPSLELAHELLSTRKAKAAANTPKVKATERKRKAPPVEGGRNRSKGVQKGVDSSDMTIEAALEQAFAEHA